MSRISYTVEQVTHLTCAVGATDLIACIDSDKHGFVLQPAHSWTF